LPEVRKKSVRVRLLLELQQKFGFTQEHIVAAARKLVQVSPGRNA
jgi:hypothetical protein